MHLGVTPWLPASISGIWFSSGIVSYFKMFTSWTPEMECHHHKGANSRLNPKLLLIGASKALPVAREPQSLVSPDSYFLSNDAVSCTLWFTLRWWSHYAPCFFFQSIGKHFLRKILYKSLKCLARKLGKHLEKKQHRYFHPKCIFVSCLYIYIFFTKDNTRVPLSHVLFLSKSIWRVQGLSSGA